MLDTTTGRWMQEDPTGFAPGDFNLYRDVANNPTNQTDPTGLFPVTVDESTGGDPIYQGDLDSSDLKGSISVWAGRTTTDSKNHMENDTIELRFQPEKGKALPKDIHWLQFVKTSYYKDKNTKYPDVDNTVGFDHLDPIVKKTNEWGVDSVDKTNPYYDASFPCQLSQSGAFFSIFDSPTRGLDSDERLQKDFATKGVTIVRQYFDTYLVYNKKAYYEISWTSEWTLAGGKWTRVYTKPTGKALDGVVMNSKNFPQYPADADGGFLGSSWGSHKVVGGKVIVNDPVPNYYTLP